MIGTALSPGSRTRVNKNQGQSSLSPRCGTPLKRTEDGTNGRFAWILDPEGNKVELWEPKRQ